MLGLAKTLDPTYRLRLWDRLFRLGDPALLGNVEDDPVGITILLFVIERVLERGQIHEELAAVALDIDFRGIGALDLEAEMVDPDIVLAALHARHLVGVILQQRDVDVAVGEIDTVGQRRLGLADAGEAQRLLVELRGLLGIGNGQRDMADASHGDVPRQWVGLLKKVSNAELTAAGCSIGCQ